MTKMYFSNLLTMLMVAMLSFGFASCSSDDDEVVKTTYTLKWNTATYGVDDVTLFEYTESGDKIANQSVDNITQNGSYRFTASERATKVKIYFKIGSSPKWVQQVFYLKIGTNTDIEVTDHSMVGSKEP